MKSTILILFALLSLNTFAQENDKTTDIVPVEKKYTFLETYYTQKGPVAAVKIAQDEMRRYLNKGFYAKSFNESVHLRALRNGKTVKMFYVTVLYEKKKTILKKVSLSDN